ncbi:MAG: GspH/FimT family pseudopilin [Candidatus Hydrogenedentes bacterium]|nr:GspH/FimT family pseudopilin [Candidatus Hydrogenedentota bacterium]
MRISMGKRAGRNRQQCWGFTLLELLVVIGIMALLLAVGIPAFESFSKRSLNSASPGLMSTLRLARQHAITHRRYVWVVFPDAGPSQGGVLSYQGSEVEHALRSYAVIEGDENNLPNEYITDWKYLPQGIYFDAQLPASSSIFNSYNAATVNYPFPDSQSPKNHNIPAIEFRPNGRAYTIDSFGSTWNPGNTAHIYLIAGIVNINTSVGALASAPIKVSTNNALVRVFGATGQMDYYERQ